MIIYPVLGCSKQSKPIIIKVESWAKASLDPWLSPLLSTLERMTICLRNLVEQRTRILIKEEKQEKNINRGRKARGGPRELRGHSGCRHLDSSNSTTGESLYMACAFFHVWEICSKLILQNHTHRENFTGTNTTSIFKATFQLNPDFWCDMRIC